MKINQHIEIVASTEAGLSSMSLPSREAIRATLEKYYTRVGVTIVNNLSDLEALVRLQPDLVFLGMKFIPKNPALGFRDVDRIWVSEYLEQNNVAYTGSSRSAHELDLNKPLAKQRVLDAGLITSSYFVANQNSPLKSQDINLKYPLFVKPTDRGGGMGIDSDSVVHNFKQLTSKVQAIRDEVGSDSLIEEYLSGREISVAILKRQNTEGYHTMPIEKIAPLDKNGERILTQQIKSADSVTDAEVTDKIVSSKVTTLALKVFDVLGACDYGRIDIRLDKFGTPHFLEVNLIPSLIEGYGSFPKACKLNRDIDYESMLLRIVNLGFSSKTEENETLLPTLPMLSFETA